ncbi:hypothetical protein EYS14_20890 [Alteromonadaceae bacterium M269]|nr:hypothetical protein EYS14_20890 [Alteromonadaceae bacterium M269]
MNQQKEEHISHCTECGRAETTLFSNRPLHKGTKETLLVCVSCASELAETVVGQCHWCGANALTTKTKASRLICLSCKELCQELAQQ